MVSVTTYSISSTYEPTSTVDKSLDRTWNQNVNQDGSLQGGGTYFTPVRLRDLDSLQTAHQIAWPVPSPLPPQDHGHQMARQDHQHWSSWAGKYFWYWGLADKIKIEMDWSCNAHDGWPHPKAAVSLRDLNRYPCTRSSTQALQRCCQVLLKGMQHSSDGMGSLNPWPRFLEAGCLTRMPNVWVKTRWGPGEEETGQKGATKYGFKTCGLSYLRTTLCLGVRAQTPPTELYCRQRQWSKKKKGFNCILFIFSTIFPSWNIHIRGQYVMIRREHLYNQLDKN